MHDDELPISPELVRRLLARDLASYAGEPVRPLGVTGSSNALFRVGDDLLARLPRQPGGSATILKEARWGPVVGRALGAAGVATPEVVVVGEPGFGYPEAWSVVRWIEGVAPERLVAADVADVLSALWAAEVPAAAQQDPDLRWYRGESLEAIDDDVRAALDACRALPGLSFDIDRASEVWSAAMADPEVARVGPDEPVRWLHGDLLAENLLVRDGRLAAVLDLGGLSVGDPSVDLVVAWELLDAEGREALREALRVRAGDLPDAAWERGRAWALAIAVITFPYYWESMPTRCASRLSMLDHVLADA